MRTEEIKIREKTYQTVNRDRINAVRRKRLLDPLKRQQKLDANLRSVYGITYAEKEAMFEAQGNCCANPGCKSSETTKTGWHIDHDHLTGKIRGILCHWCNVGIGHFKDDISRLKGAITYLERSNA